MSCLDVMYQVYGPPPQPYFAAAYSPYHHQKLAFYSKMQEAQQESVSASSSFSTLPGPAAIKEEECAREKEGAPEAEYPSSRCAPEAEYLSSRRAPEAEYLSSRCAPEAEYLSSRCVLFSYFHGDISAVVDEHFSRALSQPSSYAPGAASKAARDGSSFPMSQRSFPPSFWNSAYQPSLSSSLGPAHTDLPFPGDPYTSASLHSHLHQPSPDSWHAPHHHHHHHHPYSLGGAIAAQGSAYPRPAAMHEVYGTPFDPRYGSLLVSSVRPHRLPPAPGSVPPGGSSCDLGKGEAAAAGAAWSGAFAGAGPEIGLNVDAGLQAQEKSKDLYWF